MSRRSILLGTYDGFVFDPRSLRVAEALRKDYDVTVVAPGTGHPNPISGISVIDAKSLRRSVPGFVRLLVFWFQFIVVGIRKRPHIVYASDYYMAFPGIVVSLLTAAYLVYDAHELIIPEPDRPVSNRDRFFYVLERWAVKRSNVVAAASAERADRMQVHYGLATRPLVLRNISPSPEGGVSVCPTSGEIVLVYQGDMNLGRGIGLFVSALRHLDDRFRLRMIGGGPDLPALRRLAEEAGVSERVAFTGRLPRHELVCTLRQCHIGLIAYPNEGLNNILCAPNKIYEYPQAGLPVVTTGHPPLRSILQQYSIGVWVGSPSSPATTEEIARAIKRVADNLDKYRSAIPAFLQANTWEQDQADLQKALERCC